MTNRARWILAVVITGMLLGMFFRITHFAILNLVFIFWIAIEWIAFRYKTTVVHELFERVERRIDDSSFNTVTLALNQSFEVVLEVKFSKALHSLRFFISDLIPQGIESTDRWPAVVDLQNQGNIQWKYRITPRITGELTLPGLQVTIADKFGFFRLQRFVAHRQRLVLMPFILQPKTTAEKIKRENVHLQAGHHRFRKAGISSELLGIREYQQGDPPRSIAWKATARVGKLMTCEYESEVPIGATILADVSGYQFWGRPGFAPFDSIASVVASITRLLNEDKDPVGAVLVSGGTRKRIQPGLGQRQLIRILGSLLQASPSESTANDYEIGELEELVWRAIYRIQPELVSDQLNRPKLPLFLYGPRRRYQFSIRRQAAAALNWVLGGSPSDGYSMVYDDRQFRRKSNQFFSENPAVVNEASLAVDFGAGRVQKELAVKTLSTALVECVARAHDNELFTLVGDFNVRPECFRELFKAVRVARARYHRVMVVNVPGTRVAEQIKDSTAREAFEYIHAFNTAEEVRYQAKLHQLGATLSVLEDVDLLEKVVGEIQILKTGVSRGLNRASLSRVN